MADEVKIFLGYGQSRKYTAAPGRLLLEEGRRVYSIPEDFFHDSCEGVGCKGCKWTGENKKYHVKKPKEQP